MQKRIEQIYSRSMVVLFALLAICRCSLPTGGAGGETTNGMVTGKLIINNCDSCDNAQVFLFPADYDPVKNRTEIPVVNTDASGRYVFFAVPRGDYTVLAVHKATGARTLIPAIDIENDTVVAPTGTLLQPGSIKTCLPPESDGVNGYIYIPGTACFAYVTTTTGYAVLDSVPAVAIPMVSYSSTVRLTPEVIRYNVPVNSSDTALIRNPSWNRARTLILNTSGTGAGTTTDLTDFPVLVRLNKDNFDFAQTQSGGADIRFAKPDGTLLASEIERWDIQRHLAEIWVNLDTIRGNDSTQSMTMLWDDSTALPNAGAGAVFDTAAGYAGVWHLDGRAEGSFPDATANRYHGTSPDSGRPLDAEGTIGICGVFDGIDDFITMPNTASGELDFPEKSDYTVSAWVSFDLLNDVSHLIVAKGHTQYFLWCTYPSAGSPLLEFVAFGESSNAQVSIPSPAVGEWLLLAGVRQGSRQLLYCNGVIVDSTVTEWPQAYPRDASYDLTIGRFLNAVPFKTNDGSCFFKGSIDEVRVIGAATSPDWHRLCYMNQRSDDRLVTFR